MPTLTRPTAAEYAPYYGKYIETIPDDVDILDLLERQLGDTVHLLSGVSEDRASYRYADGKWTVKQVVGHMVDAERVFAYRALCFARGDAGPFPSFEQDSYVASGGFDARALRDLVGEFVHVRRANVHMLRGLPPEAWAREGIASNVRFTVRAMPFILAGHERHHVRILREKYL